MARGTSLYFCFKFRYLRFPNEYIKIAQSNQPVGSFMISHFSFLEIFALGSDTIQVWANGRGEGEPGRAGQGAQVRGAGGAAGGAGTQMGPGRLAGRRVPRGSG